MGLVFIESAYICSPSNLVKPDKQAIKSDINIFYLYDKLSKGVSMLSNQLPYSLKLVKSYPVISNSKAAKGLLR